MMNKLLNILSSQVILLKPGEYIEEVWDCETEVTWSSFFPTVKRLMKRMKKLSAWADQYFYSYKETPASEWYTKKIQDGGIKGLSIGGMAKIDITPLEEITKESSEALKQMGEAMGKLKIEMGSMGSLAKSSASELEWFSQVTNFHNCPDGCLWCEPSTEPKSSPEPDYSVDHDKGTIQFDIKINDDIILEKDSGFQPLKGLYRLIAGKKTRMKKPSYSIGQIIPSRPWMKKERQD